MAHENTAARVRCPSRRLSGLTGFQAAKQNLHLQYQRDAGDTGEANPAYQGRPQSCGKRLTSIDRREMLSNHLTIGLEPVAVLDELAALHRPDLYPTTTLVILGR